MPLRPHSKGVSISVRLTPSARRDAYQGVMDTPEGRALKISVTAIPEDGKANKALIAFLAKEWKLPKSALSLLSGDTNKNKVLLAEGDTARLTGLLQAWLNTH